MLGIIIWGSKGRSRKVDSGEFYCPSCRTSTTYTRMRASRYFTLYFIPIFPMETLGEWVVCSRCSGEFDSHIPELSSSEIERALSPWECSQCGNQNAPGQGSCLGCQQPRQLQV